MSYTRHGHPIPGTPVPDGPPPVRARCGGPRICQQCALEVDPHTPGRVCGHLTEPVPPPMTFALPRRAHRTEGTLGQGRCTLRFGHTGAHRAVTDQPAHPMLRYFEWEHLPVALQGVSRPFGELASALVDSLPDGTERDAALRKLLEAKDAAVRAALDLL